MAAFAFVTVVMLWVGAGRKRFVGVTSPSFAAKIAMWILFTPVPRPDAPYWPGRRWLAALDAIAWPAGWALVVAQAPMQMGIVGLVITASAALFAVSRLQRALLRNERYRFTTWRWGKVVVGLVLLGWIMKLVATA